MGWEQRWWIQRRVMSFMERGTSSPCTLVLVLLAATWTWLLLIWGHVDKVSVFGVTWQEDRRMLCPTPGGHVVMLLTFR